MQGNTKKTHPPPLQTEKEKVKEKEKESYNKSTQKIIVWKSTCARRTKGKSLGSLPNSLRTIRSVQLCINQKIKEKN